MDWAVSGEWGVKDLFGRTEEQAAMKTGMSVWLRDDMVGRMADGRSSSDCMIDKGGGEKVVVEGRGG